MNNKPEVIAKAKFIKISPDKARRVAKLIRNKETRMADAILNSLPQKGARLIKQVLKSAVANAVNNEKIKEDNLYV